MLIEQGADHVLAPRENRGLTPLLHFVKMNYTNAG